MALSPNSQLFRDARNELDAIEAEAGSITSNDVLKIVNDFNLDLDEFKNANKLFVELKQKGMDEPNLIAKINRGVTGAFGSALTGVSSLTDSALKASLEKDTYNQLQESMDAIGSYIPEPVRNAFQATLDPYHGEGATGMVSEIGSDIGSYFVAGAPITKVAQLGIKSKAISPYLAKTISNLGVKSRRAIQGGGLGVQAAIGTTIVEDPRQNAVDYIYALIQQDEEALKKLEEYERNPDSAELNDYFSALLKNISLEGSLGLVGGAALTPILDTISKINKSKTNNKIKTSVLEIGKKLPTKKFQQYFSSRRGTDDATLAAMIKKENAGNAALKKANGLALDLKNALETDLKSVMNNSPNFPEMVVTPALAGDKQALKILQQTSPKVFNIVKEMRNNIDTLSKKLTNYTGTKSPVTATINKNLGTYLTRSYEMFDNPEYKKLLQKRVDNRRYGKQEAVDDKILERAAEFIANQKGINVSDPAVQTTLDEIVKQSSDSNDFLDFIEKLANKETYKNSGKFLLPRKLTEKDIPIRNLLGEIKDPEISYIKTYEKLYKSLAENEFLEDMSITLNNKFNDEVANLMSSDSTLSKADAVLRVKNSMVDMSGYGQEKLGYAFGKYTLSKNKIKNPLQNVYADKQYANFLNKGLQEESKSQILNALAGVQGATQKAKTVYNVGTHIKNITGNMTMLAANGILPTGKTVTNALDTTAASLFKNKNNKQLGEKLAEYDELGITNSGLGIGEMRQNLKDLSKLGASKWLASRTDKTKATKFLADAAKKGDRFLSNIYQAEDDFFKIVHYEHTLDYLKRAYPLEAQRPISNKRLKQIAAQRTRDLMPNYNLVPTAIKKLRFLPIGDFVSFPAEMIRVTKNLGKYTLQDLGSSNKEIYNQGVKRLAGTTLVATIPSQLSYLSRINNNISKEEHDSLEMLGPEYEVNTDKIYLSNIKKDEKTGHKVIDYINIGMYDPYGYIKQTARNMHDIISLGLSPEEQDFELNKTATALFDQTVGPFLGPSMFTEAMSELISGRKYGNETPIGSLQKGITDVGINLFDPSYIKFFQNRKKYEQSGMTDYYSSIPEINTKIFPGLFGLKTSRLDLTNNARYNLNPYLTNLNKADATFRRSLNNPNLDSSEKIFDEFKNLQRTRIGDFKNIKSVIELYKSLGYDLEDIAQDLDKFKSTKLSSKTINELSAADNNMFIPYIPKTSRMDIRNQTPIPYDSMVRLYEQLYGKDLE